MSRENYTLGPMVDGGQKPPKPPAEVATGEVPKPKKEKNLGYLRAINYTEADIEKLRVSIRDTYELNR